MKKILIVLFLITFLFLAGNEIVSAKAVNQPDDALIEKEGIYDVPGHPNLKVKVFVYHLKNSKPSPSPTPLLVCPFDPESNAFVSAAGWHLPADWVYTLNLNSVPSSVGSTNLATIASFAFGQWTNAANNKVNILKTPLNTTVNSAKLDGKNIIAWGRTSNTALAITYTWYYPSTGLVAEVDTIMNQRFPWFWNPSNNACTDQNSYDAQNILTHELGHWMGLNDAYILIYANNTMYGYGSKGETKKDTLTLGDIASTVIIYP